MRNRGLIVPGIYLSDIAQRLQELGIEVTKEQVNAYAIALQNLASAYVSAALQDTDRERCEEDIDLFRFASSRIEENPMVKPNTVLGSGYEVPTTFS